VNGSSRGIEAVSDEGSVALLAMSDRTLVLLKPDAVQRKLAGQIIARIEAKGLDIVALDLRQLDEATLSQLYAEHVGKGFYADLVAFMSSGPVVAIIFVATTHHIRNCKLFISSKIVQSKKHTETLRRPIMFHTIQYTT
jgi:nucleoside diphosphate kinase